MNARLDGIEKRFDLIQGLTVLKAEVKEINERLVIEVLMALASSTPRF